MEKIGKNNQIPAIGSDNPRVDGNVTLLADNCMDNEDKWLEAAEIHINKGEFGAAVQIYENLIGMNSRKAIIQLSESLKENGFANAVWDFCTKEDMQSRPGGLFILGWMYENGRDVPQDDNKAVEYYQLSADQGNASAQFNLGRMYQTGRGIPQDDNKAVEYYQLSANQGNAYGQYNLGWMYANGRGVPQDDNKAVEYYQLSARQGNAFGQFNLGCRYANGRGVAQDDNKAVEYYQLSADQGNAAAQDNLGRMYENGHGVKQDYAKAIYYYTKAGQSDASDKVNDLKEQRTSLKNTEHEAAFQKNFALAMADDGTAQMELGLMYRDGIYVHSDKEEAEAYFKAAYNNGYSSVKAKAAFMLGELTINRSFALFQKEPDQGPGWYKKAHEAGHEEAAYKLSQYYRNRSFISSEEDIKQADYWLNEAVKKSHPEALGEKLKQDMEAEKKRLEQEKRFSFNWNVFGQSSDNKSISNSIGDQDL